MGKNLEVEPWDNILLFSSQISLTSYNPDPKEAFLIVLPTRTQQTYDPVSFTHTNEHNQSYRDLIYELHISGIPWFQDEQDFRLQPGRLGTIARNCNMA